VLGLSPQDTIDLVERVRVFVVRGDGELPLLVAGQPGFDAASISHLEDVRSVLSSARIATVLLAIGVGLWIAATIRLGERSSVGVALKVGAAVSALIVLLAAAAAVFDFSVFFTAFHGLFFEAGTWTFPYDSLLIRLFPESFWVAAGMGWAALVLTIAGAYWIVGWRLAQEL
jgi:integral membrane protein (TIGR01906 family)